MKPFDLEKAIVGKPVVTRNGYPVRILCTDRRDPTFSMNIVALIKTPALDEVMIYDKCGSCRLDIESEYDLFMAPEKKEGWVNLYVTKNGFAEVDAVIYESEKKAQLNKDADKQCISTVKINWEE